ncbi:MAG TPA: gluconate 2-dehydrogenase subunit 3 family protein [Candidatus Dormibacteraeota bacterium]|nr:gluconate 2-dehydrogenase subunit 3 family protein [Candidatus Dormibacteraeota bacterium]
MADLSTPHHLPNHRPDRQPADTSWLPRQRRGTSPQMIGRYPDYDVFDAEGTWDDATRQVIGKRMGMGTRRLAFFDAAEEATLRAFCDVVLAQDGEPRVPVAEMVDETLCAGRLDGYQYAGMPDDRETWHLVLRGLDETARRRHGAESFAALDDQARQALVGQLAGGTLHGGSWDALHVKRAFSVCMRATLSAFYSHPWAWNEIGFGGPAYPRGYMRLGPLAVREPYERRGATDEDPVGFAGEQS